MSPPAGKSSRGTRSGKVSKRTSPSTKRQRGAEASSVRDVMKPVRDLRSSMVVQRPRRNLEDMEMQGVLKEVLELGGNDVQHRVEEALAVVVRSIMKGDGFRYVVPTRSASNQLYIEEIDRIVLKDKTTVRAFANTSTVRKTAITTRIMGLVWELCKKGIHTTKRDLYYTDVKLFSTQTESDDVLNDVACMIGCTRTSLSVVASEKGVVIGRVRFREAGDLIDCTRMGVGGKAIPPYIERITDIESDAEFILLVEKDAAFMRLAEDRFYNKYACIIITAKGQPDVATRLFLNKLKTTLKIPILGLVDSDPYGLKILSVYMSGSKNMSYDSANLTTPDIKWLGIRPSDLNKYNIPEQCRLKMTEYDIKTGKELLEEDFISKNEGWFKELELMVKNKEKAEIQALSNFGFQYLTMEYLPRKLAQGDWL